MTPSIQADFDGLCSYIEERMAALNVPGVAIGILHEGVEYVRGLGVTSLDNPLPVTDTTLFQIGSTTKTVTGTIAMRLVEEGKLSLDEPVRTYLPGLALLDESVAERVTMRHLLTHTGGWMGDHFADTGPGDNALDLIVAQQKDLPQLTALGELWHYNNAGFYLAGRIIEVITGKPYEQAAREMVLDPLGMKMSFFTAEECITYRVAIGHNNPVSDDGKIGVKTARPWGLPRSSAPVGGIISTVRDQLTYARFHMGDGTAPKGTRLLSPQSMALMQTRQVDGALGDKFGITWFLHDLAGTRVVRHGGATNGQTSAFQMVPSRNFAITILTNGDVGTQLYRDALKWTYSRFLGLEEEDPKPLESTEEELAPYLGDYTYPWSDITLFVRDGQLMVSDVQKTALPGAELPPPDPPLRAALCGPDMGIILDEPAKDVRAEFLRGEDGAIKWMRVGGRVYRRGEG